MKDTRTIIDLGDCMAPLAMMVAIPALFLLALIVGQVVVYGGW